MKLFSVKTDKGTMYISISLPYVFMCLCVLLASIVTVAFWKQKLKQNLKPLKNCLKMMMLE